MMMMMLTSMLLWMRSSTFVLMSLSCYVHFDVVVHNDQIYGDDVLMLVLFSDVVVSDVLVLYDVVADHDVLCISLLDGFLSLYAVCYADDVVAIAMSSMVVDVLL